MTARDAWGQVAHDLRVLADSIDAAIDPDAARASVATSVPTAPAVAAAGAPPPAAAPSPALGICPTHRKPWHAKEAGISKNGNPYPAFWKCSEKDGDAWCNQKPDKAWVKTHPPEQALIAGDGDLPF